MTYLLDESLTNGFSNNALYAFSFLSVLCGILVITSKNPIVSVLFLIGLFLSISGYLMVFGFNFIGLSYLLVYVGAVSILFLFILMLINVRVSELTSENTNSIPLAVLTLFFFNLVLYNLLPNSAQGAIKIQPLNKESWITGLYPHSEGDVFHVTSQTWDGALAETSHITTIGNVLYTSYPMWLILTSLILLLAMVGAIVITIKQKTV